MWLTLAKLLVAIAAAFPSLLKAIDELRDAQRAAAAEARRREKDQRVEDAISKAVSTDHTDAH